MSETLKFGNGKWAVKEDSALAYNDENGNFKPLPFTFVRDTIATRVNKEGLIEVVPNNEPRIDFLNDSKGALKLEPSRSNLIEQSNNFSAWSVVSNVTLDADSSISPDGKNTATKIIPNSSNSIHQIRLIYSSATNTYNFSVFAKKGEYKNILIWDDTVAEGIGVNLDDLSIFRNENVEGYKIEQYSNGWVRISYTRSYTSEQPRPSIYVYDNSATPQITFSGNGSDGLYLWGAQLEQGSYATSIIPTQGSIGTRDSESSSQTPPDGIINSSEGVLYYEALFGQEQDTSRYISINDNTSSNRILIGVTGGTSSLKAFVITGGIEQAQILEDIDLSQTIKVAISYKEDEVKFYKNGILVGQVPSVSFPTASMPSGLSDLDFSGVPLDQYFYGNVKDLRVYNEALTDAELISLTS